MFSVIATESAAAGRSGPPRQRTAPACRRRRGLGGECRPTERSRPITGHGTLAVSTPTAPTTTGRRRGRDVCRHLRDQDRPSGQSRQRGPIPTMSSTQSASRWSCSTTQLCIISASRSFYDVFRSRPMRPWAGNWTPSMAASDDAAVRSFLDRCVRSRGLIEDYSIDIELASSGNALAANNAWKSSEGPRATRRSW